MDAWTSSLAFSKDEGGAEQLLDAAGTQVMMEWERPYMVRCVNELAITPLDRVLEIGFGCGYSAARIQHFSPRSHTIVECAAAPLAKLRAFAAEHESVEVVHATWQAALPGLGVFDAIFFDDFGCPEMAEVMESCADPRYQAVYAQARSHFHAFVEMVLTWHSRPGTRISGYIVQPSARAVVP